MFSSNELVFFCIDKNTYNYIMFYILYAIYFNTTVYHIKLPNISKTASLIFMSGHKKNQN